MDTPDIIRRIRSGEHQAYALLVRRWQAPLFAFLGHMGLPPPQAQELAQEAFLRAWTHLDRYDPQKARFSTWLFTMARRLALNELDRPSHRLTQTWPGHSASALAEPADHPQAAEPELTCPAPTPEQGLELAHRKQQLHMALGRLQAADRCVIALACLREMSLADVARIEACSEAAIKTRLHRARQRLHQELLALRNPEEKPHG